MASWTWRASAARQLYGAEAHGAALGHGARTASLVPDQERRADALPGGAGGAGPAGARRRAATGAGGARAWLHGSRGAARARVRGLGAHHPFLPPGNKAFPGIIDIFGVGGGLLEYRASLLAGKGFSARTLAYYNYEDLPKDLDVIHLEYFEEAVTYLLSHSQVKGLGIGLLWISKVAELCLSMASFLKGIGAAVIITGSGSVVSVARTLKYKAETLSRVGTDMNRIKVTKDGFSDMVDFLNVPLEGAYQNCIISVEKSDRTFLFLVGQDDRNWKSEFYAREVSKCLQMGRRSLRSSATQRHLSLLTSPGAKLQYTL